MLTVYSDQGSGNCYKVRLLLAQLGISFRVVEMDVLGGHRRDPVWIARNPIGRVPAVELDDGTVLPESDAILLFFAEGTPLLPADPVERHRVLQWLFFEQNLHEPSIAVARFWCLYLRAEREYADKLVEKRAAGNDVLAIMERWLAERDWFAAGRYTIADIALYAYTHVGHEGGFDLEPFPTIRAWLARVARQPGHVPITHVFEAAS